mgnify:CR=1 FL=1
MLRLLVLLLVLANAGFYAWTQGWLDSVVGVRAQAEREPERLARQVRPETVRILAPQAASAVAAAASAASAPARVAGPACLEAGPFDAATLVRAETVLKEATPPVPLGSWADVRSEQGGSWILYMGKFANREAVAKKEEELKRYRSLPYEVLSGLPEHEPGISLGRYNDRALADKALEQLALRGIRTARVLELAAPTPLHTLRFAQADARLVTQLVALRSDALGQGFVPCATLPATN